MIRNICVVCVGNICRSPLGERALKTHLPQHNIHSAGIAAVVGAPADEEASAAAGECGLSLADHIARQFTAEIGAASDLILVMEPAHRHELMQRFPQISGKIMLFDHWTGGRGIEDPYRRSAETHRKIRDEILSAAEAWASRLGKSQ